MENRNEYEALPIESTSNGVSGCIGRPHEVREGFPGVLDPCVLLQNGLVAKIELDRAKQQQARVWQFAFALLTLLQVSLSNNYRR